MKIKLSVINDKGIILAVILIGMTAITAVVLTTTATTTSTLKIANNYSKTVGVFNLAEVGIAKARTMIENQDLDTVLNSYGSTYLISPTSFGNMGTYEVTVSDDAKDTDGNPNADSNNIIVVTSIGRNANGGRVTIRTHLQLIDSYSPIEFPPDPTSCLSASGSCESSTIFCGTQSEVGTTGGAWKIDGADYEVPGYGCSGSGCNSYVDAANASSTGNYDIISQGALVAPGSLSTKSNLGSATNCDQWQTFYNQWASVSASAPGVVVISSNYSTSNDCSSPKVFIINSTSPSVKLSGYMCGMFIVASNTLIDLTGTTTIVGNILAMGNYANVGYQGMTGTSNFFGKLIFKSTTVDSAKELAVKGNAAIKFSSDGEGYALNAINNANGGGGASGSGSLITASWEEIY